MEFYLLEFRLNGIKNIEKTIEISFYKQDIRNFNRGNYNVKGIFGRNGIGKTAVIKGIEILRNIVLDSDYLILKSSLLNEIINKKLKEIEDFDIEKRLNVKIKSGILELLKAKAKANNKTISELIRTLISEVLNGESKRINNISKVEKLIKKNDELIKSFNKLGVVFNQAIKLKIVGMEYKKEYLNLLNEVEEILKENKKIIG